MEELLMTFPLCFHFSSQAEPRAQAQCCTGGSLEQALCLLELLLSGSDNAPHPKRGWDGTEGSLDS